MQSTQLGTRSPEIPVRIDLRPFTLEGELVLPAAATGLVMVAQSRGRSRAGAGTGAMARALEQAGLGTCVFDLLTSDEERFDEQRSRPRFHLDLLAGRLIVATDWARSDPRTAGLRIGYLAAGSSAAAALVAASERTSEVGAIVSLRGCPDIAGPVLAVVRVPTLLIAGERDPLLAANRRAFEALPGPEKRLEILGAGARVSGQAEAERLTRAWFEQWLPRP
jgi:putative phosphoribosyl transferase